MSSVGFSRVRCRSLAGCAAMLVAAAFAAPLSAQTLDLNRVLRSLPLPPAVTRAGEQASAAQECERLKRWVSSSSCSGAGARR